MYENETQQSARTSAQDASKQLQALADALAKVQEESERLTQTSQDDRGIEWCFQNVQELAGEVPSCSTYEDWGEVYGWKDTLIGAIGDNIDELGACISEVQALIKSSRQALAQAYRDWGASEYEYIEGEY